MTTRDVIVVFDSNEKSKQASKGTRETIRLPFVRSPSRSHARTHARTHRLWHMESIHAKKQASKTNKDRIKETRKKSETNEAKRKLKYKPTTPEILSSTPSLPQRFSKRTAWYCRIKKSDAR